MIKKVATHLAIAVLVFSTGCKNGGLKLIDSITFKPSDDLEVVRISLVFSRNVKSDLAGAFSIKDYGFLFINPYNQTEPFEVGFSLNTRIVNDQDFVNLTPTQVLPNGLPIGGPDYALVQISSPTPISSKFDLFGYADVLRGDWLGVAAMFTFINDQYFPEGLSIGQTFMRNQQGDPGVIAKVFGPTLKVDGTLERAGGIAVFANVRQLIDKGLVGPNAKPRKFYPEQTMPLVEGPQSPKYRGNLKALQRIQNNLIRGFNQK